MPQPTKGHRLGSGPAHERLLLANLATALFEHGRITTTEAKARRLRPLAERLITKAKRGDLHNRRQVLQVIRDKSIVHALFDDIGPRYESRPGGYTRITKIGPRKGDNAPMAVIELVEALTVAQRATTEAESATRRAARERTSTAPVPATGPAETSREVRVSEQTQGTPVDEGTEAGDQPAEGLTSAQTSAAAEKSQAEGDEGGDTGGAAGSGSAAGGSPAGGDQS